MVQFDPDVLRSAEAQHGVFTVDQARAAGIDRHRELRLVTSGRWESLGRGLLRVVGSPPTWRQQLWLGVLEAPAESGVSHWSAQQLVGLPGDRRLDEVHVLTPHDLDHRARHSTLHQTRSLPPEDLTVVEGIPCTTIARTIFDLARTESPKWIGILLDAGLHQRGMSVEDMVDTTLRLAKRGRGGTRTMRVLVAARMRGGYVPTESVLEAEFVALCEAYSLPEPERQILLGDDEDVIGRVDFFYRPGLVVELDGRAFHDGLVQQGVDAERDARLKALGIDVLRLTWKDVVGEPAKTAAKVRRRLSRNRSVGGSARWSSALAPRTMTLGEMVD
jgi:predicted transcriptional regulator of viral defense system